MARRRIEKSYSSIIFEWSPLRLLTNEDEEEEEEKMMVFVMGKKVTPSTSIFQGREIWSFICQVGGDVNKQRSHVFEKLCVVVRRSGRQS